MVLLASSVIFALFLQLSAASTVPIVRRAPQSVNNLWGRATFVGAAPLRAQTCPTELKDCGVSGRLGTHYCCPSDTVCATESSDCCPNEDDCSNMVRTSPSCADPSWDMFIYQRIGWPMPDVITEYFCCPKGQLGYSGEQGSRGQLGGEACGEAPLNVASSLLATATVPFSGATSAPGSGGTPTIRTGTGSTTTGTGVNVAPATTNTLSAGGSTNTSTAGGSGGMTTTTIAGIAGGAIAGIILMALALWCAFRSGRKKGAAVHVPQQYNSQAPQQPPQPQPQPQPPVMPTNLHYAGAMVPPVYPQNQYPAAHTPNHGTPEKDADFNREELDGMPYHGDVHEMPGAKVKARK